MAQPSIRGEYPEEWQVIADRVKRQAGRRCIRCGHPAETVSERIPCDDQCDGDRHTGGGLNDGKQRILTVHHFDGDKANVQWWNLMALCQACHLSVQARVNPDQPYMFEHSDWAKPYIAGFYAHKYLREALNRADVEGRLDELLLLERRG